MTIYFSRILPALLLGLLTLACGGVNSSVENVAAKSGGKSEAAAPASSNVEGEQTAIFAGGCFWGVEAVFEHVKGVRDVTSGFSGGTAQTVNYETVSSGETSYAESVKVVFDPAQVSYEQLLKVFFSVAHDPTQLNRQGPDVGTQYRSAIFYTDGNQKIAAEKYVAEMTAAKTYAEPIVTQIAALDKFYKAEDYHQNYLVRHPNEPYIVINDLPKVENLRTQFPDLFVSK